MANKLEKIILKNADWKVKKINFSSQPIIESLKEVRTKQEESFSRKDIDSEKMKLIIKF